MRVRCESGSAASLLDVPSVADLRARARRARLVLTDCDGVLTDGTAYYGPDGEALKRFSMRDGMGVERLRAVGIEVAILTRERSSVALRRAEKLRLPFHFEGVQDKAEHLAVVRSATGRTDDELAFIGDDVNDLGLIDTLRDVGLTGCPVDAVPEVAVAVHFRTQAPGGAGAFREFAEWILRLRGDL